ncbi:MULTISPECIES: DUF4494 domain-containing protein [Reichenbachiella]|uniref:DUF4494 domain-containing protein n=1 Tax=Reichenbachiella agariperforans TaxID=156994 RepID=A0A1M6UWR7_REIAG|nr:MULTISPECIES: DUF4494 domain-containing protein [Reichenbachiella]MBU2912442.1 DUF4494 domain-containing protein [Reichenbachiella agariperforans]RJE72690.1 hypothetical protein BGP76_01620 [Reichenbachiella sp. MSK19-1]SHK73555.1 protein of unknown function [Reichenbachiella agariperforans]
MRIWYSCKVKYGKVDEEGVMKQTTEAFLVDALTYTEAESRIYEAMERDVSGEFSVNSITKTNIGELLHLEDADYWYKAKVSYSTVDGDSDKEVKVNTYFLVNAEDLKQAFERVSESLNTMLVPFEIPSIAKTNIVEVYPYDADEEAIPDNLTPVSELEEEEVEEEVE